MSDNPSGIEMIAEPTEDLEIKVQVKPPLRKLMTLESTCSGSS